MSTGLATFTKINESFDCRNCGHAVPPASSTCRDHCPKCLHSVHVDVNPGDRAADCGGTLKPVAYSQKKGKGFVIQFRCEKCSALRRNKFLENDAYESDSFDVLLRLSGVTGEDMP